MNLNVLSPPEKAIQIEFKSFDSAIGDKNIGRGETVEGWIFLNVPKNSVPLFKPLRFRVADTAGNVYSEPFKPAANAGNKQDIIAQPMYMKTTTNVVDITSFWGPPQMRNW